MQRLYPIRQRDLDFFLDISFAFFYTCYDVTYILDSILEIEKMAKKKITWEDPVLIDLGSVFAYGASCHSGSTASDCAVGAVAAQNCNTGNSAGQRCGPGLSAAFGEGLRGIWP
jgi:SynChlorMet cassette protein ScmA